jgi:hypothetical protein
MCKCLHAPKICGKWAVCKSCSLEGQDLSQVNCLNNCSCDNSSNQDSYQVTQNNMFVKFVRESDNKVFMGVWRPIYKNGSIRDWELRLLNELEDGEFLMQISKLDSKSCKPTEIFYSFSKKGDETNPVELSYGALKKVGCTCC